MGRSVDYAVVVGALRKALDESHKKAAKEQDQIRDDEKVLSSQARAAADPKHSEISSQSEAYNQIGGLFKQLMSQRTLGKGGKKADTGAEAAVKMSPDDLKRQIKEIMSVALNESYKAGQENTKEAYAHQAARGISNGHQVASADAEFMQRLNELLDVNAQKGKGVAALYHLLTALKDVELFPWFNQASLHLKKIVLDFLQSHQYVIAFYEMINFLKIDLRPIVDRQHIKQLDSILESEKATLESKEATLESLYFALYRLLREAKVAFQDVEPKIENHLKQLVVERDELRYFNYLNETVVISNIGKFDDLAHKLICNLLMKLPADIYSTEKRNLLSGLLDYMKARPGGNHTQTAIFLFMHVMNSPHLSLDEILEQPIAGKEKLKGEDGILKQAGYLLGGISGRLAQYFPRAESYAKEITEAIAGESAFGKLINNFRNCKDMPSSSNDGLEKGSQQQLDSVRKQLTPYFDAVTLTVTTPYSRGFYPFTEEQFIAATTADKSLQPRQSVVASETSRFLAGTSARVDGNGGHQEDASSSAAAANGSAAASAAAASPTAR